MYRRWMTACGYKAVNTPRNSVRFMFYFYGLRRKPLGLDTKSEKGYFNGIVHGSFYLILLCAGKERPRSVI